ncbi:MAG: glycoside hydrolase [Silvibacterium sp.]|nr:glycoside hydrolase [Silvibacterium sp.]
MGRAPCLARPILAAILAVLVSLTCQAQNRESLGALHDAFRHPPDDSRIMMRWWWFGPAVTKPELQRELEQMKAAGIGGVEIATLYPLALDDPQTGFHNAPFLSDEHIEALRFAVEEARKLGLRVDITLGSGWPFGGPHIPVTEAAGELRTEIVTIPLNSSSAAMPNIATGERFIAAFLTSGGGPDLDLSHAVEATSTHDGRLIVKSSSQPRSAIFFISSRTGMTVKRAAVGSAGFVLDHYDSRAIETHLRAVGDRLLEAFGDEPPYAVFSDSLEDYGSDWTPNLLDEFRRRRGYDLTPYLPALVGDIGPETAAIRHDWGRTLTELANENFLQPMHAWAQRHHTLLRSQTYGYPPVSLASNQYEDLPEGEGKATFLMWREFSDTRWAASAGHLFHRPVISSETWTWLHSPAFRATPLDLKAEADLHFLQGINQLVGHGWPYSPEDESEPGWRMYAAAALNAHNPWFAVMPELALYLERTSFALRQGEPANDVAVLLPDDDAWATFRARLSKPDHVLSAGGFDETGSNVTLDESIGKLLGKELIGSILDAGFNFDFIDADAIDKIGIPHKAIVLPGVDRIPAATYARILAFANNGGVVIASRHLPATTPGFQYVERDGAQIRQISHSLFQEELKSTRFVQKDEQVGSTLAAALKPDFTVTPANSEIGFIHRKLPSGDLYFLANTGNRSQTVTATFRDIAKHAEFWDAFTGEVTGIPDPSNVHLSLAPYESRLIFFSDKAAPPQPEKTSRHSTRIDLSRSWKVRFGDSEQPIEMAQLHSWTEDPRFLYYSGLASYEKSFDLPATHSAQGASIVLDFGPGTPVEKPSPPGEHNMRAYIDGPVREAAQVYVNGQYAGNIWKPPYQLDITAYVKAGENSLRLLVANTAINQMAGKAQPDYRLLWARYGVLFIPQDMQNLQPLPSGIMGPVTLVGTLPGGPSN